jgi:hypothetical protein
VVTERSAARVNLSPPLSGIDLAKASSITLSPNSNLLPKCYLPLHQTNSGTRLANFPMTSRQPGQRLFLPRPYPTWSEVLAFD